MKPPICHLLRPTLSRWLCLLICFPATACLADSNQNAVPELDWYPTEQLTPEQQKTVEIGCCGAFVDPLGRERTETEYSSTDKDQGQLSISGETSRITKNSTVVSGNVELLYGHRKLTGDEAELFNDPQAVQLEGNVGFREPGFLLRGRKASVNLEEDSLLLENASYVIHEAHVHGTAGSVSRDENGVITLTQSTYSYCEPEDPLWQLRSQTMSLNFAEGQGKATHVRLEIENVPIFYFPYLRFPIGKQRQSGFLTPSLSNSEEGFDISLPYYFNLAPNYDLTLIPRQIEDRGTQLGSEFRHLSPYLESTLSTAILPDDKQTDEDRWLLALTQSGGSYKPWSMEVDIARVSDRRYFEDLGNSGGLSVNRTTHLKQSGKAGYITRHWLTEIAVENYQILRDNNKVDDPYELVPRFTLNGSYALNHGFYSSLEHQYAQFNHNDSTQVTGQRLAADYALLWRNNSDAFLIEPAIKLHHRQQHLDNAATDSTPSVTIPGFSIDSKLVFERSGENSIQQLEPRLMYAYTDYENQDSMNLFDTGDMPFDYSYLYSTRRFSGYDRVADANQTAIGFLSRWIDRDSGSESMSLGIGQIFYHRDRDIHGFDSAIYPTLPLDYRSRFTRPRSPIAAQWRWHFAPNWHLNSELAWRDTDGNTEHGNLGVHYKTPEGALFTAAYRHREILSRDPNNTANYFMETIEQGDVSSYWPLSNQWSLMGSLRHDFSHNRSLEALAGFQYEDCCWRLRAAYRRWRENPEEELMTSLHEENQGIYIEIQFKNLASTGNKIESLIEDSVYGYTADN